MAEDGSWTVEGLECGTDYVAVQIIDGVDSDAVDFTTADCPVNPDADDDQDKGSDKGSDKEGNLVVTGGEIGGLVAGAVLLLALGIGSVLLARRRRA